MFREILVETEQGHRISLDLIQDLCPACGSSAVGTNGTQEVGDTRCEELICHDPGCFFKAGHSKGKQFRLRISRVFLQHVWDMLRGL